MCSGNYISNNKWGQITKETDYQKLKRSLFMSEFWSLLCLCIGKYNFRHTSCWNKYWLPFIFWLQCSSFKIFLRPNGLSKKKNLWKHEIAHLFFSGETLTGVKYSKSMKRIKKYGFIYSRSSKHLQKFLAEVRLKFRTGGYWAFMLQVFIFLAQPPAKENKQQQGGLEMFLKRQKICST